MRTMSGTVMRQNTNMLLKTRAYCRSIGLGFLNHCNVIIMMINYYIRESIVAIKRKQTKPGVIKPVFPNPSLRTQMSPQKVLRESASASANAIYV